uniref:CHAT domain-containing protein n=1 Tax=Paludisphaera rhizosphaerae TaxID=2711216 RepID=UPI001C6EF935
MANLKLVIEVCDQSVGGTGQWWSGTDRIGEPIRFSALDAQRQAEMGRRFLELFESGTASGRGVRPLVEPELLAAMGRLLSETWFRPVWDGVKSRIASTTNQLMIQSSHSDVLNLPWELVELETGASIGCDPSWSLYRSPLNAPSPTGGPLRAGPLRVLFLASAPVDQGQLDYDREEDAILRATSRRKDVSLYIAEMGSFEALRDLVAEHRPHVVHLLGHGTLGENGVGSFAFEDERGRTDLRGADRIVADVFRGGRHGVRCVFFNGCQTSQAATAGLCQSLVKAGVPLAVGWSASVADDRALRFAEEFYRSIGLREPVPIAVARARETIRRAGRVGQQGSELQDATFALPQVYASLPDGLLFDASLPPEPDAPPRTTYMVIGNGIKGLREGFVGRRREQQRLVPAIRDGEITFAVLTGLGDAGKSTLATRAANRLKSAGFEIVPIRAVKHKDGPEAAGRELMSSLKDGLGVAFIRAGREDLRGQITNGQITEPVRLDLAVRGLNEVRALLVVDNFEDVLDPETRRIADATLAEFYCKLAYNLVGESRAIVTCRYLPEQTPIDQPTVDHLPLPDFTESDYLKFLRRDPVVADRIACGDLKPLLLHQLHAVFGGTPGFLVTIRKILRTADADELRDELDELGDPAGVLAGAREAYYENLVAVRLYTALHPDARSLVSRLAVSELPLPPVAVAQLTDLEDDVIEPHLESGVAFGLLQRFDDPVHPPLYHPPGLLRPWLTDASRLSDEVARDIDRRLAAFWKEYCENDRENEYRVSIESELLACRRHADRGGDRTTFRWATLRLSHNMEKRSDWLAAHALLQEIPLQEQETGVLLDLARVEAKIGALKSARERLENSLAINSTDRASEAAALHSLATIDLNEGSYAAAREKFARSLEIRQAVGDRAGEAAVWYDLASLDLEEGSYAAAREKFARSLAIEQAVGDRAGESAAWRQLARIDLEEGSYAAAREKFARSLAIEQAVGDRTGESAAWRQLARIDLEEGSYAAAREKFAR